MKEKDKQLAVRIFATSVYLQELLDKTEGRTSFKNKTRFHVNGLQDCLTKINSIKIKREDVSLKISDIINVIEEKINSIEI